MTTTYYKEERVYLNFLPRETWGGAAQPAVTLDGPQRPPALTLLSGDLGFVPILGSVLDKFHFSPGLWAIV